MTGAGVGPDDDEPHEDGEARRARLWRQLLDGELTEVYVLCEMGTYQLIPQTLGLEPIGQWAYYYSAADGEPTSAKERDELARNLSEQRFWIAGGGRFHWDRHFIERARIALILLKPSRLDQLRRGISLLSGRRRSPGDGGFSDGVKPDRAQVEFHKRLTRYYRSAMPTYAGQLPVYEVFIARHLLEKYPDKTFIVSTRQELKQLRALHIPRPPRPGRAGLPAADA